MKVATLGATLGVDEAAALELELELELELSSWTTFWSSAQALPESKATLTAAAATLNLILDCRALFRATQRWRCKRWKRRQRSRKGAKSSAETDKMFIWAIDVTPRAHEGRGESLGIDVGRECCEFEVRQTEI